MNRLKKEARRRYLAAREGLTPEQIAVVDAQDELNEKIEKLARSLHVEKFPEEYDYVYDSSVDSKTRAMGGNPMSSEYIEKIRIKREAEGVSPLSASGMSNSNDSFELCVKEVKAQLSFNVD